MSRCEGHADIARTPLPSLPGLNPRGLPLGRGSYRKLEELIKKAEELERKCNPALKDGKKGLDEDLTDFQRMKKKIAKDVAEVRQVPRFLAQLMPPMCTRCSTT